MHSRETSPIHDDLDELTRLFREKREDITCDMLLPTDQLFNALNYVSKAYKEIDKIAFPELGATTALGKMACALDGIKSDPRVHFASYACPESEMHLLHSIALAEDKEYEEDELRPVVHVDIDGRPVAYTKHSGNTTTFILRPPESMPSVVAGTILYNPASKIPDTNGMRWFNARREEKIQSSKNKNIDISVINRPLNIAIIRPSIFSLPQEMVQACDYEPLSRDILEPYAQALQHTNLHEVIARVDRLI